MARQNKHANAQNQHQRKGGTKSPMKLQNRGGAPHSKKKKKKRGCLKAVLKGCKDTRRGKEETVSMRGCNGMGSILSGGDDRVEK